MNVTINESLYTSTFPFAKVVKGNYVVVNIVSCSIGGIISVICVILMCIGFT